MRPSPPAAPDARLLFVGAPPPRIVELADRRGGRHRGARADARPPRRRAGHADAADVVVDASYAGLGITGSIREALACERPVVATELEGMPELVIDGETGLLVPPRDPDALAAAVLRLLADPTRRHADGARGAQARGGRVLAARQGGARPRRSTGVWSRSAATVRARRRRATAGLLPLMRPLPARAGPGRRLLALDRRRHGGRHRVAGEAGHGRHLHPPRPGDAAAHPAAAARRLRRQGRRPATGSRT